MLDLNCASKPEKMIGPPQRDLADKSGSIRDAETQKGAMLAELLLDVRRLRDRTFDEGVFGEPSWNILLDLYVSEDRRRQTSIKSACIASGVPHTTALRWIAVLVDRGYLSREDDPFDGRRSMLFLTQSARDKLERVFACFIRFRA